jgi:hypothetical protein
MTSHSLHDFVPPGTFNAPLIDAEALAGFAAAADAWGAREAGADVWGTPREARAEMPAAALWPSDTPAAPTTHTAPLNAAPATAKRIPNAPAAAPAPYTSKLQAARDLARRGFSVFPLKSWVDPGIGATDEQRKDAVDRAKIPAFEGWKYAATTDLKQIEAWWTASPNANIGISTAGLFVVDVDTHKGGIATLEILTLTEDFPPTVESITQSDGLHILYRLPEHTAARSGVNVLGQGIDVRSYGGYIVAPGSEIAGRRYRWRNDAPLALVPPWMLDLSKAGKPKGPSAAKRLVDEDQEAIERAFQWLAKHAPDAQLGNRGFTAYKVACRLYEFAVSRETCEELLATWSEAQSNPPMDLADIQHAAMSADRNMQNAKGSKHSAAPGFEPVDISESQAKHDDRLRRKAELREAQEPDERSPNNAVPTFAPVAPFDPVTLPRRPWVIPNLACRNVVTLVAGPGGVAKSTWTLQVAVAGVTRRSDICGFAVPKRGRVLVWNQEDDLQEMQRRLAAIMQAFDVSWDDLKDESGAPMLFFGSGVDTPLMLAQRRGDGVATGPAVSAFMATVRENAIDTLILDPLVELHEVSENDNVQMRAVIGVVRNIAKAANCAAIVVTHVKKPDKARRADGFAGDMDTARGASSQIGLCRIGLTVYNAEKSDDKHWKFEGSAADYVRIDLGKNNLGAKSKVPMWFKIEPTFIGGIGGESAAVLRPVSVKEKITTSTGPDILNEIARAISNNREACDGRNLGAIESYLPADTLAALRPKKYQAEAIDKAFDGALERLTDFGKLTRENRGGKVGWVFNLAPTPMLPQGNTGNSK